MRTILLTYIIFSFCSLNAQTNTLLKVKGITTNGGAINTSILEGVTVNIYKYNDKIDTFKSDKKGNFQFEIEMNSYIILEFLKEGFLSKKILFDTKNQRIDYSKNYIPFNFEIMMLEEVEDVNYDDIDFPITMIKYSEEEKEFLYVEKYTNDMIKRQEKVITKLEKKY